MGFEAGGGFGSRVEEADGLAGEGGVGVVWLGEHQVEEELAVVGVGRGCEVQELGDGVGHDQVESVGEQVQHAGAEARVGLVRADEGVERGTPERIAAGPPQGLRGRQRHAGVRIPCSLREGGDERFGCVAVRHTRGHGRGGVPATGITRIADRAFERLGDVGEAHREAGE